MKRAAPSKSESLKPIMAYFAHKPDMVEGTSSAILKATKHIPDDDFSDIAAQLLAEMGANPYQPPVPAAFLMKYQKLCALRGHEPIPEYRFEEPRTPTCDELMGKIAALANPATDPRTIEAMLITVRAARRQYNSLFWRDAEELLMTIRRELAPQPPIAQPAVVEEFI